MIMYLCVGFPCKGVDAVLGHVTYKGDSVSPEQLLRRLKHSAGSGVLSVAVLLDGPTRILRVTDVNSKVRLLVISLHSYCLEL